MKLRNKIILSMSLVFMLFSIAIAVALAGMQSAKNRFESFLQTDLALLQAATGMYADGLQSGQALRNVVLDPANKQGLKNLEKANLDFNENGRKALALSAPDPADRKTVEGVLALREQYAPVQLRILGLAAKDQAAAITSVSQEERLCGVVSASACWNSSRPRTPPWKTPRPSSPRTAGRCCWPRWR
jgi:type II secretory pathway pseudopilin PulG